MQYGEKKPPKLIDHCLKKRKKKKNLAHLFSGVVGVVGVSISGIVSLHSLSLPSRSRPIQFLSCGFCVFEEEEQSVFYSLRKKRKRQIRVFLSPQKEKGHKICPLCPSHVFVVSSLVSVVSSRVSTVSEPYPNPLTYYLVNDTPHGVLDTYPTRVHVSAYPHVRHTDTP